MPPASQPHSRPEASGTAVVSCGAAGQGSAVAQVRSGRCCRSLNAPGAGVGCGCRAWDWVGTLASWVGCALLSPDKGTIPYFA